MSINFGQVCVILGAQWGDEGKGKLVDILAKKYDMVVRATGGANAGHTICLGEKKFIFHLIPSGMLHPGKVCVMGNGMVIHLPTLLEEIKTLKKAGIKIGNRLLLSDRAHIAFDYHKAIDRAQELAKGKKKVGTTLRGIGPAYMDKISRSGIRAGELRDWSTFVVRYKANLKLLKKMHGFSHDAEKELKELKGIVKIIKPYIVNTEAFLGESIAKKKKLLVEGANGALLDVDHGTFPFVTSSNATIGGVISGTGIAPRHLSGVIGIMKAYVTRVGAGPFPTELPGKLGEQIRISGGEFGSTTGRPRRCGWFDAVVAKYSTLLNGYHAINLTKVDVLNDLPQIKIGVAYRYKGKKLGEFPSDLNVLEQCTVDYITVPGWLADTAKARTFKALPKNCQNYIKTLEKLIGVPIAYIGVGPSREQMICR